MNWKPSRRKVVISVAVAALCIALETFLAAPQFGPMSLGRATVMGLTIGYLISPWFESIHYPPGYFRLTPARLMKALGIAGVGVLFLVIVQAVTHCLAGSTPGLVVALLFIAGCVYVRLGSTPQSPAQ